MLARADVVKPGQENAAQLVAEALSLALEEVTQSHVPWEPGWALVVAADNDTGEDLYTIIMPIEVIISHCPWLDDAERARLAKPLPIDQRRVVAYIFGYSAMIRYFVPDGTTSN